MPGASVDKGSDVFRVLSDNSPNMIFINDFNGVVYVNHKCTEILGYTQEEFLSPDFNYLDLIKPEFVDVVIEALEKHGQGIDIDPYEYILIAKDGTQIPVVISTKLVEWNGKPAVLGTVTDISEYKSLETKLQMSEEQYMHLLDSTEDAVFGIKGNSFVYANKAAVEMLGFENREQVLALPIYDIVAPEQREMVIERTKSRLRGENPPSRYEVKLLRKDGETVQVEFNISSTNFEGEPMNLTVARDISEAVRHRNRLTALIGHAIKLATSENMDEIISSTLDAMEAALEFQYSSYLEVVGDNLVIRSRYSESQGIALPLDGPGLTVQCANTKRSVLVNDTSTNSNYFEGSISSLSELDVPILLGDKVVGVLNVEGRAKNMFTENDLQALKLLAIHVATGIDRLNKQDEVERLRDEQFKNLIEGFRRTSASVRHDLRSPLMTIINATNILKIQPDNKPMNDILMAKVKFIEAVLEDWKHLTYSGELNRIDVEVKDLVDSVLEGATVPSQIEVIIDLEDGLEFSLDKNGIIRVLSNIVKNSVEAIDGAGRIVISAGLDDGLWIKVKDDGEGINEGNLAKVFTPFFTTKETGTGIGLSYVKETVEAHGGSVDVISEEGMGTEVTLTFPSTEG